MFVNCWCNITSRAPAFLFSSGAGNGSSLAQGLRELVWGHLDLGLNLSSVTCWFYNFGKINLAKPRFSHL